MLFVKIVVYICRWLCCHAESTAGDRGTSGTHDRYMLSSTIVRLLPSRYMWIMKSNRPDQILQCFEGSLAGRLKCMQKCYSVLFCAVHCSMYQHGFTGASPSGRSPVSVCKCYLSQLVTVRTFQLLVILVSLSVWALCMLIVCECPVSAGKLSPENERRAQALDEVIPLSEFFPCLCSL